MPFTREETRALLGGALPLRGPHFELGLAEGAEAIRDEDSGDLVARLVLAVHDEDESGARALRDMKEQEVRLAPAAHRSDGARVEAFLRASTASVPGLVAGFFGGEVETLMPADLVYAELLADPELRSVDDFARAIADSERLGRVWEAREREEMLALAERCGVGAHGPALLALRRYSIRLRAEELAAEEDEDSPSLGDSRIGGLPDLPRGMKWPLYEDRPLVFLAQIDLAVAALLDEEGLLPRTGFLWFFYDALEYKEPTDTRWRGGARVFYSDVEHAELVPAQPPAHPSTPKPFPAYPLTLESERMLPPLETPFLSLLDPSPAAQHGFGEFSWHATEWDPERPIHRMLGYATPLQGDPYLQAQVGSVGASFEGWNDAGEREQALLREAAGWRLLLQVDSEPDNSLLHQDGGYYYFFIREEDLRAGRFEEAWGILQCH